MGAEGDCDYLWGLVLLWNHPRHAPSAAPQQTEGCVGHWPSNTDRVPAVIVIAGDVSPLRLFPASPAGLQKQKGECLQPGALVLGLTGPWDLCNLRTMRREGTAGGEAVPQGG